MAMSDYDKWTIRGPIHDNNLVTQRVEIVKSVEGLYILHYFAEYARSSGGRSSAWTFWGAKRKARRIIKRMNRFRELTKKEFRKGIAA